MQTKRYVFLFLTILAVTPPTIASAREKNLVQNPECETASGTPPIPTGYDLQGAAAWARAGGKDEFTSRGIVFPGDSKSGGEVSQVVHNISPARGRWITFQFRGLPEDGFAVTDDALAMKIGFYSKNGTDYLDGVTRLIYREIEKDRQKLAVNGDYGKGGAEVWRTYELEELIPFPEVDTVKVSIIYKNGAATSQENSAFFITDFSLIQRTVSLTGKADPADAVKPTAVADPLTPSKLVALGGRWFYQPIPGESVSLPLIVTEGNSDRLFYRSDRLINPFANNMTAWLRAGYKDEQGQIVTRDRLIHDNVVLTFNGDGFLTVRAKNLPNHPTAVFPDTFGTQGYNPSYIQELNKTYRLPLEPVLNPDAKAIDLTNSGQALPMGAIGIAVNGVVFYNPFDAGMRDASSIMDRCCGHPSPDNRYHYHKYPACVNTPFVDKGDGPSEVIGFAFDGLPIYGPYQSAGIMAKDSTTNPLNAFNACYDSIRGWHYHVTPGKFPYIIGGYFAKAEPSNFEHHPQRPPGEGFFGFRLWGAPPPPH